MTPNFLVVGASRSGTTALYDLMQRHDNIFVPAIKELHYFTFNHIRCGTNKPMSPGNYEEYFQNSTGFSARGEISPSYLWVPGTAKLIYSELSNIKIILLLRNPVERAISDYQYSWQYGHNRIDFTDFSRTGYEKLMKGELVLQPFHPTAVIWKGFYTRQVQSYIEVFGVHNTAIFLFDDIINDPSGFRKSICDFLQVSDKPGLALQQRNARPVSKTVPDETRKWLLDVYADDIQACASLINQNLDAWLTQG